MHETLDLRKRHKIAVKRDLRKIMILMPKLTTVAATPQTTVTAIVPT